MERILVVDDEEGIRTFIQAALANRGYAVTTAESGDTARRKLAQRNFHLLITDLKMPGIGGMDLLRSVREEQPEVEVIVLTAHGTVETAVEAMKLGAFDFLSKPLEGPDQLRLLVDRALERRRLRDAHDRQKAGATGDEPVAADPAMRRVLQQLRKVAATNATVLLVGESGTGKEVAARFVHDQSPRHSQPFVAVNCASLSEHLMASELFGHEKGAFTGATERRRGRFELADGGTLFLDEVAEMRPDLQARLLRVLEERRFERLGGSQTIEVEVRLVAATNRELAEEMEEGRFREDLYHRLAVFPVRLPPLRERPGDILPLARHLLKGIAAEMNRPPLQMGEATSQRLMSYPWPGNVRELRNALERAVILAEGDQLEPANLILSDRGIPSTGTPGLGGTLKELEEQAIRHALEATGGHRKQAAERLDIGVRTLYAKIKEYGL